MRLFFVCMGIISSLTGCAACSNEDDAECQNAGSMNLNKQGQMGSVNPNNDNVPWSEDDEVESTEGAWQIEESWLSKSAFTDDVPLCNEDKDVHTCGNIGDMPADVIGDFSADVEVIDLEQTDPLRILTDMEDAQQSNPAASPASEAHAVVSTEVIVDAPIPVPEPQLAPKPKTPKRYDKVVYLTFDDGPSTNTPKILEILRNENVKATFFVVGHHEGYSYLIRRVFKEGHAIGAHTYSHKYSIYTSQETYFEDLEKVQQTIEKFTGNRTNLIRFPGGSSNTAFRRYNNDPDFMHKLCQEVRNRGYQYFDWNQSSHDASRKHHPPEFIAESACSGTGRNICILLHDSFGKENTVEALPDIIKCYKDRGYHFGTLSVNSWAHHHI